MGGVPLLEAVEGVPQHWEVLCRAACLSWGGRGHLRGVHRGQTLAGRAPATACVIRKDCAHADSEQQS